MKGFDPDNWCDPYLGLIRDFLYHTEIGGWAYDLPWESALVPLTAKVEVPCDYLPIEARMCSFWVPNVEDWDDDTPKTEATGEVFHVGYLWWNDQRYHPIIFGGDYYVCSYYKHRGETDALHRWVNGKWRPVTAEEMHKMIVLFHEPNLENIPYCGPKEITVPILEVA
jgi:hypothetical protein